MQQYPIYVEQPENSNQAWGIEVPDLPGCFSAADQEKDIIATAREAILLHLDALDSIPSATSLADSIRASSDRTVLLVDVDTRSIEGPAKRINITIREGLLRQIDAEAKRVKQSRSEFLANSARDQIAHAD